MNTVKRAIIMAAGFGSRMRPVTDKIPKPLIEVNGTRMIDTVIDGLKENSINEIYVVVGYLKEQFKTLEDKYKGLKLIENPYYDTCNNISSLYVAREYLGDCMILDGDMMIYNQDILSPQFKCSGYNAIWTDEDTDEWLMTVENEKVVSCSRTGGKKGWILFSISRWTMEDGIKLRKHLEIEFEKNKNTNIYWDDVAMFVYPDEYELGIRRMEKGDVIEIDSVEELASVDSKYEKYVPVQSQADLDKKYGECLHS